MIEIVEVRPKDGYHSDSYMKVEPFPLLLFSIILIILKYESKCLLSTGSKVKDVLQL
jgi:hypothetical protein